MVGLACSGGGIRSASFCLGVIQFLIKQKLLTKIDYLSTVSGGGYIGSCISTLAKDNAENLQLLTDKNGRNEPDALNHIRNYSEYLRASGFMNGLRTPILFVEGVLRSILTFFPLVIPAVFITELFLEMTGRFSAEIQFFFPLLVGVLPLTASFILRPVFKDNLTWQGRDTADGRLVIYVVVALTAILSIPLLHFLRKMVGYNATTLLVELNSFVSTQASTIAILASLLLLGFVVGYITLRTKMILIISSLLAPVLLVFLYLFFCIQAVNSPFSYDISETNQSTMNINNTSDASAVLHRHEQATATDVFDENIATKLQALLLSILNKKIH